MFRLTPREQHALNLLTRGLCNKAIAREMGIHWMTLKTHLHSCYNKLGVHNRTAAALMWRDIGQTKEPNHGD